MKNEKSLELPAMPQGAQLTIVVEGMGRINFGRAIKDYKGIIGNVTLTTQKEDCELAFTPTRWNNSSIADDYQTAVKALTMPTNKMRGLQTKAGYYRGYFNLKKVGDTFINMEAFGKGQVYVNGHALRSLLADWSSADLISSRLLVEEGQERGDCSRRCRS